MEDATTLIIEALKQSEKIVPAGKYSLLSIAARALDPETALNKGAISLTLGMHAALVVPILVTSDLAGDTMSRREMGEKLFSKISLRNRPPILTNPGKLAVAVFCAEQLMPAAGELSGLLEQTLALGREVLAGDEPDRPAIKARAKEALELQRVKVVAVQKGAKSKMGVPDEEACKRRGAQAIRALLDGLSDGGKSQHLCPTVAGEVAWTIGATLGLDRAVDFCVDLATFIAALPPEVAEVKPGNGG